MNALLITALFISLVCIFAWLMYLTSSVVDILRHLVVIKKALRNWGVL